MLSGLFSNVWSIFLVVLFFGGSIFFHELGHFLAARRRGVKVDRFSIGFGQAIWSRVGRDGVEYRVGWLPIGGYVLLPQLADLSALEGEAVSDTAALPPVSYLSKIIVFVAGAFFNILFAFVLATILWISGQTTFEQDLTTRIGVARTRIEVNPGQYVPGPAYAAGLREGDVLVAVDGKKVDSFSDVARLVALDAGRDDSGHPRVNITFERDGVRQTVAVLPELAGPNRDRDIGIEPAVKVLVDGLTAGLPAEAAGLKAQDVVISLDGHAAKSAGFVTDYLRQSNGKPIVLAIERAGAALSFTVQPRKVVDPETKAEVYRLGLQLAEAYTPKTIHVAPWSLLAENALWTWRSFVSVLNPRSDIGLSKLSGPIGIAERVHTFAKLDFKLVLAFVVLVNVNLAIFNLLPIPVLDGGQILFATIGRLRGRALPVKFVAATQSVFMVLILSLMLYVTVFGDIRRIVRDSRAAAPAPAAAPAKP